ncbi:MAG: rRNA maturation RNase YbeY [Coleofasciculaceae cyanobacterium]
MQVEVNVQDCFSKTSQPATNNNGCSPDLIPALTWEIWFHKWLENLQPNIESAQTYELSLRLTDDLEIQSLNAQYRQQDKPTDVLAFASLEVNCPQLPAHLRLSVPLYLGDIIISVDTAQRQAQQQRHSLETELVWLTTHGLLHLLGWDHPDQDSLIRMLNQQEALLEMIDLKTKA